MRTRIAIRLLTSALASAIPAAPAVDLAPFIDGPLPGRVAAVRDITNPPPAPAFIAGDLHIT